MARHARAGARRGPVRAALVRDATPRAPPSRRSAGPTCSPCARELAVAARGGSRVPGAEADPAAADDRGPPDRRSADSTPVGCARSTASPRTSTRVVGRTGRGGEHVAACTEHRGVHRVPIASSRASFITVALAGTTPAVARAGASSDAQPAPDEATVCHDGALPRQRTEVDADITVAGFDPALGTLLEVQVPTQPVHLDTDAVFENTAQTAVTFEEHMTYQVTFTSPGGLALAAARHRHDRARARRRPSPRSTARSTSPARARSAQPSIAHATRRPAPVVEHRSRACSPRSPAARVAFHVASSIGETFTGGGGNVQARSTRSRRRRCRSATATRRRVDAADHTPPTPPRPATPADDRRPPRDPRRRRPRRPPRRRSPGSPSPASSRSPGRPTPWLACRAAPPGCGRARRPRSGAPPGTAAAPSAPRLGAHACGGDRRPDLARRRPVPFRLASRCGP